MIITNVVKKKRMIDYLLILNPTQLIVLGFITIILIGSVLLKLPMASKDGNSVHYIDALFTATSATCVTGLVVFDTYRHWTVFGQIVILSLIQVGGLGFMTMATLFSLLVRRKISFRERLLMAESLNQYSIEGIVRLTKKILFVTLIFESIGAVILSIKFSSEFGIADGIYKGIFHAISSFCNAGFDIMGEAAEYISLTAYTGDVVVNLTVMALVVIGGLGFFVWDDIFRTKGFRKLRMHTKLVLVITLGLILFGFIFFLSVEYNNPETLKPLPFKDKILAAMFQSVTTRTAGFNTISLPDLTNASKFMSIFLMFIGGSPGSTAGGIKTVTAGVLLFAVFSVLRGNEDTVMFKKRLHYTLVLRALSIVVISILMISCTTVILSLLEKTSFINQLFEAVSAFGTVGLSMGITPSLTPASKIVIIATMFFGRVGVLTIALALTFKRLKAGDKYKYPQDKVMVG